ncbi:MAG: type II secretion system minor pseudopilin GspK [Pseudomonadales bacterium]
MSAGRTIARKEHGAALVVALLIAALVAVIGVRMGNEYQLTLRRSSNVIYSDQIMLYLYSAESIAKQLLLADIDQEIDYRGEPWAEEFPPVPIGQGMLAAQPIQDLQGRFNINSLEVTVDAQSERPNQEMFIRLLLTFPDTVSDASEAQAITDAVVDWLDSNSDPTGFDGAEDAYYGQLDVPYRTSDDELRSVSELRLVKGITPELYRQLAPHLTVLDVIDNSININTATKNVLQAVSHEIGNPRQPLSSSEIEAYLEELDPAVGLNKQGVNEREPWSRLEDAAKQNIVYKSDYFSISGIAKLGEISIPMRSVLKVDDAAGKVTVLSRSTGSL